MNSLLDSILIHHAHLEIVQGDITLENVDAIVNAANAYLQHGGGVAGAIVRKGGQIIQQESEAWIQKNGRVSHAHPAYTSAGRLPCRMVIHTVGPIWGEGNEDAKLTDAIWGTLELANELKLTRLAIPAISTGIYGFPKERAAKIILSTQFEWINSHPTTSLKTIRNVLYDDPTTQAYIAEFAFLKS
jgi:O-acetyl-ADP-ribose deacetylase